MELQLILDKFGIRCDVRLILDKWNESHRYYHNLDHLTDLISKINEDFGNNKISKNDRDKLIITALFHDVVYEPSRHDNEERSVDFFMKLCSEKYDIDIVEIKQMILDTKKHVASTPLSQIFIDYDMGICSEGYDRLLEWESGIRMEYSHIDESDYKKNRLIFLESIIDKYPNNSDNILDLINFVKTN